MSETGTAQAGALERCALKTPIGTLVLTADGDELSAIALPGGAVPACSTRASSAVLAQACSEIEEYFAGARRSFEIPLALRGTPFQKAVWQTLATIPYGTTMTYSSLAAAVGRPAARRAVGQANGANRLPIVLPCHRVVAAGGAIGGYAGGLTIKRALLAHEGVVGLRDV